MEQHSNKLYDHDGKEEEHEDDTDRLEMKILLGDEDLGKETCVREGSMLSNCLTNYNTRPDHLHTQNTCSPNQFSGSNFQHNIIAAYKLQGVCVRKQVV